MSHEVEIARQASIVKEDLRNRFGVETDSMPDFSEYAGVLLHAILSLKVWKQHIGNMDGPMRYLDEMVSNLTQILVMAPTGFHLASLMTVRRSLESILSLLYYKDHPIEFARKQIGLSRKTHTRVEDLKEYLSEFPFSYVYPDVDVDKLALLVRNILHAWDSEYQSLSKFVHSANSKYWDLKGYLEDIRSDNDMVVRVTDRVRWFSSIANALCLVFFFDHYRSFEEAEKSLIRTSIDSVGFKRDLAAIFGMI